MASKRMSRRLIFAVGVSAILSVAVSATQQAQGTNYDDYYPDNTYHAWSDVNLTSWGINSQSGATSALSPTRYTAADHGSCQSATDVCFYDGYYEDGGPHASAAWWQSHSGKYDCTKEYTSTLLDKAHLHFDLDDIAASGYTTARRRALGCHEMGHSLGLEHRSFTSGCMYDGNLSSVPDDYSSHSLGHVD